MEAQGTQVGSHSSAARVGASWCRSTTQPHDWFEVRGSRFEVRGSRRTLIVFIDDATSELMALRFAPAETTLAYIETLRAYLAHHGRSVALYSCKHSIFRVNHPDHEGELTQFTRALRTLDIEPIHANTP